MQDDVAFRSQEFAADRSREANAYRMQQGETIQQGLASLVPMYQQARQNQLKQVQAQQEIAFDELRRQEAIQTLKFTQEVHRTAMMRAATNQALAQAQLSVAQSKAAMEKLATEGYQKVPLLNEEQMEGIIAGGWKVVPGGPRGLGRVEQATEQEIAAAKASRKNREVRQGRVKAATERAARGGMSAEQFDTFVDKGGELPKLEYAPLRPSSTKAAQTLNAVVNASKLTLKTLSDQMKALDAEFAMASGDPKAQKDIQGRKDDIAKQIAEINTALESAKQATLEEAGMSAGDEVMQGIEAGLRALYPGGR